MTDLQVVCAVLLPLALLTAVIALRPSALTRGFLALLTQTFYRLRIRGRENVPASGGALLVCNHVSYIDWLLIVAAAPRAVRFVVFGHRPRGWFMRLIYRWSRVINIDDASPRGTIKGLRQASDAVTNGELVCLFAEGEKTRTSFLLPFHREFAQVVKHCSAPIVPVRLDQVWGSIFSYQGGRFFWKLPRQFGNPVTVAFGKPMPADTAAGDVRQVIQELSAECAVADAPIRPLVHRRFVRQAARQPFRACLIDGANNQLKLSYGRLLAGAMCLGRLLRPLLGDAPMVAVWLPQGAGGALANLALALLGKTSVNLNYTNSQDLVRAALRQTSCRHILTAKRFIHRVPLEPGPEYELVYLEELSVRITTWLKLSRFLAVVLLPGWFLEHVVLGLGKHRHGDLATIIFSSGSTGDPKGVMLSHGNIAANCQSIIQAAAVHRDDRLLGILPFFHSFGYTVTLWAPLQVGASAVYYPDPRAAKEIGELCRTFRCTVYLSTATFLRFCLRRSGVDDFRSVRLLVCGAEKLPVKLAQDFESRFGVLPLEGYGCTELSPAVAINTPDVASDGFRQVGNKFGSIGQPLPGVAVRIVEPDMMAPLPIGEDGLLLAYGANVMQGYLGKPELTRQALRDGWYITGDVGHLDSEGFVTLTGRLSRFAKVGGEMVPLERVQDELHDILGTSDQVCGVTCVPDEAKGERLVVLYVANLLSSSNFDVRSWVKELAGRGMPNLWLPAPDAFVPVTELPILGSGKLDLRRLKEQAAELLSAKS